MTSAQARELQARARFEALRRRVFEDMGRASARMRVTWTLPFHAAIVVLLFASGESTPRAIAQGVVVAVAGAVLGACSLRADRRLHVGALLVGVAGYFVFLATTGGLASPLLVTGALLMAATAIKLHDPPWLRKTVFAMFLVGFALLAVLSRTSVGVLAGSLVAVGPLSSPVFVGLSLLAAVFATVGVYSLGCAMTRGYERVALELAERREELCSENEDRTRALEGMAARLAHEVKNPLAAIKALSTHVARNATDAKTAERLAIVAAEADRLQAIVEGFLSFSRGLDDLKLAPVTPFEVARELAVLLETRAAEAGVVLDVSGDPALVIDADARKLRQALLNLVLNAIQASPRGATVSLTIGLDCDGARIMVRDEGAGMTADVLERIRKPYFTTKEGGTGLGVAVARGLVEQHGGRIDFKSTPGKGTTVTLALPVKPKPCAHLPNPARWVKREPAEAEGGSPEPSAPVIAGAR
ncbi:MAG TPA: HAMP domain-containing sensor histidine kinase [Polyangiaceae bacterium]|nr:HAMP domain-containing sensor histidine kinase [Polyangiaceae bacterium]